MLPRGDDLVTKTKIFSDFPIIKTIVENNPALEAALDKLIANEQVASLNKYLNNADTKTLEGFLKQVEKVDFEQVGQHHHMLQNSTQETILPEQVEPVCLVTLDDQKSRQTSDAQRGLSSLADGEWACLAFAGGSGTRFFSHLDEIHQALPQPNDVLRTTTIDPSIPKGTFPISPVGGLSFYEIIIAQALAAGVQTKKLPLALFLTSPNTHAQTIDYLKNKELWGFPRDCLLAFEQAQYPRLDQDGHLIVVDDKGQVCLTGDGHGGVYSALLKKRENGISVVDRLKESGIKHLIMHNVDNPAARPFAPTRLGFHLDENALFTLSAVRKTNPAEKVGVLMHLKTTGKTEVVEYNVIDPDIAQAVDPASGRLLHEAGNTNTNIIAIEAIRADIDPTLYTGKTIDSLAGPVTSSSVEMLSQHITRFIEATRVRAFEVARPDFFMPTKNVTGVDSAESTTKLLSSMFAARLTDAGADIASNALCDLHPACGENAEQLGRQGIGPSWQLAENSRLYCSATLGAQDEAPISQGALTLEPNSSLVIHAARPYGDIEVDASRNLVVNLDGASRISIGKNVTIKEGVTVVLKIGPHARLSIPSGRTIDQDIQLEVTPHEDKEL
jgi:UDP-N-acetylglucosamine/UDP-N-acetylgalactosamine diphosphorylase